MEEKLECKICGKIGFAKDKKGLKSHYRIAHNKIITKKMSILDYFEPTSNDAVAEIISPSHKAFLKEKIRKKKGSNGLKVLNNAFTKILYTPMGNKR